MLFENSCTVVPGENRRDPTRVYILGGKQTEIKVFEFNSYRNSYEYLNILYETKIEDLIGLYGC